MPSTKLLVVHALSPLHVGTGQSTGAIDLPIARDRATGMPLIPGSSLKGSLRDRARQIFPSPGDKRNPDQADPNRKDSKDVVEIFGPETENASDHAGAMVFTDVRLLMLPVRSVAGTFAYVTSPLALARLRRDLRLVGHSLSATPVLPSQEFCATSENTSLKAGERVVLEEFDLKVDTSAKTIANELAGILYGEADKEWKELFVKRFCLVHDDVISFLSEHATEVVTRVSIDHDTGTAKDGQLWTEENIPAEAILVGLAEAIPNGQTRRNPEQLFDAVGKLIQHPLQLGGKSTVGRGRCQLRLA